MTMGDGRMGEGEKLHAARRRHFWMLIGMLALIGAIGGFVAGFVMGHSDATGAALAPGLSAAAAAGVIAVAVLAILGSWYFFISVDEVEVADNLWGSLIGFYAYVILFPVWWGLNRLGRAPEPDDWVIFILSVGTALVAYAYRKWRNR